MSRGARIGVLVAVAAAAVVAFIVLRPGANGGDTATTSTQATTAPPTTSSAAPEPAVPTVRIAGGKPVGGILKVTVAEGGRIRFRVTDDADGQVHLHGYDVDKEVGPGRPASFSVPATITGRFEVELHPSTQVAEVTVEPK